MPVTHDRQIVTGRSDQNRCALMFCLTWIGFFAAIGVLTWVLSAL